MSKRNPVFSERSKVYYGMKNKQASDDSDQPANPWAQMQQEDERFWYGKRIRLSQDWLTVLVLLLVCAAIIGVVLLMK